MRPLRIFACCLATTLIAACAGGAMTPDELEAARKKDYLETNPVGRYQYVRHYRVEDGIEYACLDTTNGELGFALIPDDPSKLKPTSFTCR